MEPIGVGHGTLPQTLRRPDLIASDIVQAIREILYRELNQFDGFRRAMFCAECWEQLLFATADEDMDIDYGWMISSIQHFPVNPSTVAIDRYNVRYRIVVSKNSA